MRSSFPNTSRSLLAVGLFTLAATTAACGASSTTTPSTATTSSALTALGTAGADGGIDPNAAACLATYVGCLRASSDTATCKTALLACASAAPFIADGGSEGGPCHGGGRHGGGLADDGDADDAPIAACLATLDQCAASSDTSDACIGAATTCLAAARPQHASSGKHHH